MPLGECWIRGGREFLSCNHVAVCCCILYCCEFPKYRKQTSPPEGCEIRVNPSDQRKNSPTHSHTFWKGPLFKWGETTFSSRHLSVAQDFATCTSLRLWPAEHSESLQHSRIPVAYKQGIFLWCRKLGELSEINKSAGPTKGKIGHDVCAYVIHYVHVPSLVCPSINKITDFGLDSCCMAFQQSIMYSIMYSVDNQLFFSSLIRIRVSSKKLANINVCMYNMSS